MAVLYGVGVGPGDPELLTLKALRVIKESDIIAIPAEDKVSCTAYNIVKQAFPEIEDKPCLFIVMPMTKDKSILEAYHDKGADMLREELKAGKSIAFLTLGDPTVYSTYIYLHKRLITEGYEAEVISGIPSFCAVAARLSDSLAENSEKLHIIPGSYSLDTALSLSGTKVFMKTGKKLKELKQQLKEHGLQASMVENCGMEGEKVYRSLEEIPEEAGYFSLLIVK
jgi:precorrin-2/cobalt-factor-2 C20-methyltransferase